MSAILTDSVLVLNAHRMPIDVTTVENAMVMVVGGRGFCVDPITTESHDFESWIDLWDGDRVTWDDAVEEARRMEVRFLSSPSVSVVVPDVIMASSYSGMGDSSRPPRRIKFSRRNVFLRDSNQCQYCGKKLPTSELNLDHVNPRAAGGVTAWDNVVLSCVPCNSRKGGRTPAEASMKLIRQPKRPKPSELRMNPVAVLMRKLKRVRRRPVWEVFLGDMYWNAELD